MSMSCFNAYFYGIFLLSIYNKSDIFTLYKFSALFTKYNPSDSDLFFCYYEVFLNNLIINLYALKLKYHHLKPVFSVLNMHLEFSTCTHKFKCLFNIEKPVLNAVLKLSDIQNQIIIRFCTAKSSNTHFKV